MGTHISITSIEEFDTIVNNLDNCLKSISNSFNTESKSINNLLENPEVWSGKAKDKAYDKYTELSSVYSPVSESLTNYVNFLKDVSNNYKVFESSLNQKMETYDSELNVN